MTFLLSFLPSPFLTCCAILPTSFEGKEPHLMRWLVAQLSSDVSYLRFSRVFLSRNANARFHMIIALIIRRLTWHSGQMTFVWWHRHTSIRLFCHGPWLRVRHKIQLLTDWRTEKNSKKAMKWAFTWNVEIQDCWDQRNRSLICRINSQRFLERLSDILQ